jgi:hypothetical protein
MEVRGKLLAREIQAPHALRQLQARGPGLVGKADVGPPQPFGMTSDRPGDRPLDQPGDAITAAIALQPFSDGS